jgi:hypothetical protein
MIINMPVRFQKNVWHVPTMSFSSKPKKIKPKGAVRELKLVQSVNRRGSDTLKTEEVKTPRHGSQKATSTNPHNHSSSPAKRQKLQCFDEEFIPFSLGGVDVSNKRQTLVFLFPL